MTGDYSLLSKFEKRADPLVLLLEMTTKVILWIWLNHKKNVIIDNVALVVRLKHNLLSIIQLCDKGHQVWFSNEECVVSDKKDNKVVLIENRK